MSSSRRDFLSTLAITGAGFLAADLLGVREALAHAAGVRAGTIPPRFDVFTAEEAAELAAVAARIVPTTDTPGATEAGVVFFLDRAFGGFAAPGLADCRGWLADLAKRAGARRAGATTFRSLPVADQDAVLTELDSGGFFGAIRSLVVMGMFSDPAHGGNRDEVGWKLLGFQHAMTHAAPFGHYDAEYAKEPR